MFSLLPRFSKREKDIFEKLYKEYRNLIFHVAYHILKDNQLAEDATQETFEKVYKNILKIKDIYSDKTKKYIFTIAKITARELYNKKNNIDVDLFEDLSEIIPKDVYIEQDLLSKVNYDDLLKLIGELKQDLREPFLLSYAYDYSHEEIAKMLNISQNNVNVRIYRAKLKLKKIFMKAGVDKE